MFFLSHLVYQNDLHVRLRPIQKYHPAATFILIIDDDISKYQQLEKANKRSIDSIFL